MFYNRNVQPGFDLAYGGFMAGIAANSRGLGLRSEHARFFSSSSDAGGIRGMNEQHNQKEHELKLKDRVTKYYEGNVCTTENIEEDEKIQDEGYQGKKYWETAPPFGSTENYTQETREEDMQNVSDTSASLTHTNHEGKATMVDVGNKGISNRVAIATGRITLGDEAFYLVKENNIKKGDVLTVSQITGIMAAKQCSALIPLCHNVPLTKIDVDLELQEATKDIIITSSVKTTGKTGVEMEALLAVSVAALTVYDMCKAVTHDMVIHDIKLVKKTGGQRGDFHRQE